jgi:hypothetical protein
MKTVLCVFLFVGACEPDGFTPPPPPGPEPELPPDYQLVALSDDGRHALMRPADAPDGRFRYAIVDIATNRIEDTVSVPGDSQELRSHVPELVRLLRSFHLGDPDNGLAIAPDGGFVALAAGHTLYVAATDHETVNLDIIGAFRPMISPDSALLFVQELSGEFAPSGEPLNRLIALRRDGSDAKLVSDTVGISRYMAMTDTSLRAVHLDPTDRHPCFVDIPFSSLVPRRLTCDGGEIDRCVFSPSARWVACAMTNAITVRALAIDLESAAPPYERVLVDPDQLSAINDRGELVIRSAPGLFRTDDELVVRARKGLRVEPPR